MYKTIILIGLILLLCAGLAACSPNNGVQESITPTPIQSEEIATDNKPSEETKSIMYENLDIGFSIQIPSSWEGKYNIKEELEQTYEDEGTIKSILFFHNATMDEIGSGWLFSFVRVAGEHFTEDELPIISGQTIILAQTGGYTYYVHFPSGVEYNENSESKSAVEYKEMKNQIDLLIDTFKLTNNGISNSISNAEPANTEPTLSESSSTSGSSVLVLDMITSSNDDAMSAYKNVLLNNATFFSTYNNKNMTLNQSLSVFLDYLATMTISQFAIVDLDNDGTPEIVLSLNIGVKILHCQDGLIYGYDLVDRAFMDLKTDGSFSFSSGSADTGFGTISFTNTEYNINEIAYSESSTDSNGNMIVSYYVNQKSATEDEFHEAVNQEKDKPYAMWYNYTNSNIETQFSLTEINIVSPLVALDAVKNYIENQNNSSDIFSNLDNNVNPPAYYFQGSNILIQYDSSHSDTNGTYYLFHEYEYVVDDPKSGSGHAVTYRWFRVDAQTGDVTCTYNSNGSLD